MLKQLSLLITLYRKRSRLSYAYGIAMKKCEISVDVLNSVLMCDAEKGILLWKERPVHLFSGCARASKISAGRWNSRFAGSKAFVTNAGRGYLMGKLFGHNFKSHRVIYAMHHGRWPEGHVDHINGIRDDNRISNLRDVSRFQNAQNMTLHKNNTSGQMGVRMSRGMWLSEINVNGYHIKIGRFLEKGEAIEARKKAEISFGFHDNHGRTE